VDHFRQFGGDSYSRRTARPPAVTPSIVVLGLLIAPLVPDLSANSRVDNMKAGVVICLRSNRRTITLP
jgi:hypothetical protein